MADVLIKKRQLEPLEISNSDIASDAAIATSKLADGSLFVKTDGSTEFTANQSMGNNKLTDLAAPTNPNDAVRLVDLQNAAGGIDIHDPVQTTTASNITLSGLQTIEGYTVVAGDRVLVQSQTDATQNGIYVASSSAWTRATDADETGELKNGTKVLVQKGDHAGSTYICTGTNPITIGTDDIPWVQDSQSILYSAGAGLNLSGTTFSVGTASTDRIKVNASNIDLATSGVTAGTYTKVTVDAYGRVTTGANPNSLSAYGILDAYTQTQIGNFFNGTSSITGYNKSDWDNASDKEITGISFNTASGLFTLTTNDATNYTYNLDGRYSLLGHTHALSDLSDTTITSPSSSQILQYNGSKWVNWSPTYLTGNQSITLSGDVSGSGTTAITTVLATVNTNVGTYGDATHVGQFTVNGKGLITAAQSVGITYPITSVNSATGAVSLGLGDLNNVTLSSPATGNLLHYDGSKWINWAPNFLTGNQSITFSASGDVTGSASGTTAISPSLTIGANKVTYSKIQSVGASSLLGNYGTTAGNVSEITLGTGLSLNSTTGVLSASGTGGTVTSITAGNGMNFSTITSSGAVTMGTPSAVTLASSNSLTSTSHTHAFVPGGTTSQYIDGTGALQTFPSIPQGTVTSVAMTVPTGLSVSGSPITSTGTLALSFASGYSIPTTANQTIWTNKQDALNGTGFVKVSGTTVSYDNSTYLTAEADTLQTVTNRANSTTKTITAASGLVAETTIGGSNAASMYGATVNVGTTPGAYAAGILVESDNADKSKKIGAGFGVFGNVGTAAYSYWNFNSADVTTLYNSALGIRLYPDGSLWYGTPPANASAAAKFFGLSSDGHTISTRTAAQVLPDIGGLSYSAVASDWNTPTSFSRAEFRIGATNNPTNDSLNFGGLYMPLDSNHGSEVAFRNNTGYFRTYESGTWGSWLRIATTDQIAGLETDPVWTAAKSAATTISGAWTFSGGATFGANPVIAVNPATGGGIKINNGSYTSFVGGRYGGGGATVLSANAEGVFGSDNWSQPYSAGGSALLYVNPITGTLQLYSAPAGTTAGTFASFWGPGKTVATTDLLSSYLPLAGGNMTGAIGLKDGIGMTNGGSYTLFTREVKHGWNMMVYNGSLSGSTWSAPGAATPSTAITVEASGPRIYTAAAGQTSGDFDAFWGTGSKIATQDWVATQIPTTPTLEQVTTQGGTTDKPISLTNTGIGLVVNGGISVPNAIQFGSAGGNGTGGYIQGVQNTSPGYGVWTGSNAYYDGTNWIQPRGTSVGSHIFGITHHKEFTWEYAAPNGTNGATITPTELMNLNSVGNLTISGTVIANGVTDAATGSINVAVFDSNKILRYRTPSELRSDIGAQVAGSYLTASNYVANEVLSGTVNGTNKIFTLANTPVSGTVSVYLNGALLLPGAGNGYTISGSTVTMTISPVIGEDGTADVIVANYFKS